MKKILLFYCFGLLAFVGHASNALIDAGFDWDDPTNLEALESSTEAVAADVTFCVDLACFTVSDAVAVAFGFQGFAPVNPLTDPDGDRTYCGTYSVPDGEQEFKFFFAQGQFENLAGAGPCINSNNNRTVTVMPGVPQTVTYGWESCEEDCPAPSLTDINFCVNLSCFPAADAVAVALGSEGFNPGVNFLADPDGDGTYCGTVGVPPGPQEFKFFFAQQQFETLGPEDAACTQNGNRVINVVEGQTATYTYGWERCDDQCILPGANVEFCVDVSCLDDPSTVSIFGTFNNFTPGEFLTDQGNGIWCTTLFLPAGEVEYKFYTDNFAIVEEFVPGDPCTKTTGQFTNRVYNVVAGQDDQVSFGFQSCDATCNEFPPGANVTFCVNMECSGLDFNGVSVFGTFNGFTPSNPLTNQGDGTWCTTVFLTPGPIEYLFYTDFFAVLEDFAPGSPCTTTNFGFTNRQLTVVNGQDQTVNFDWESCDYTPPGTVDVWNFDVVSGVGASGDADFETCGVTGGSVSLEHTTSSGNSPLDDHSFVHTTLCGNGEVSFRVADVSSLAYVGLTMRETLSPGAKQVSVFNNQSPLLKWETRYVTNSILEVNSFYRPNPAWMKLERQGDWVFGYYSQNGFSWTPIHGVMLPMADCIEVGISLFSYVPGITGQATVDNINFIEYGNGVFGSDVDMSAFPSLNRAEEGWNLYPNPATENISIEWSSEAQPTQMNVYNQYGQIVGRQQLDPTSAQNIQLSIRDLSAGSYWIEMLSGDQRVKTLPFIKQ